MFGAVVGRAAGADIVLHRRGIATAVARPALSKHGHLAAIFTDRRPDRSGAGPVAAGGQLEAGLARMVVGPSSNQLGSGGAKNLDDLAARPSGSATRASPTPPWRASPVSI